ncbi:hypothetical protein Taro_028456 [Colocasia esculenta]|uniref:Uncharacterized protein n=1 Tax=Colocasia esculenta TaxID=4460 RepID=A0A843VQG4_COLES|nr:hypothetical protein [Colocasia esculenta]
MQEKPERGRDGSCDGCGLRRRGWPVGSDAGGAGRCRHWLAVVLALANEGEGRHRRRRRRRRQRGRGQAQAWVKALALCAGVGEGGTGALARRPGRCRDGGCGAGEGGRGEARRLADMAQAPGEGAGYAGGVVLTQGWRWARVQGLTWMLALALCGASGGPPKALAGSVQAVRWRARRGRRRGRRQAQVRQRAQTDAEHWPTRTQAHAREEAWGGADAGAALTWVEGNREEEGRWISAPWKEPKPALIPKLMRDKVRDSGGKGRGSQSLTGEGIEGGGLGFAPSPSQGPPWGGASSQSSFSIVENKQD